MLKEYKGELLFLLIAMGAYIFMATLNISQNYAYFAVVFGIFGLFVAWKIYEKVDEASDGSEKMREIQSPSMKARWFFYHESIKYLAILLPEYLFFL